MTYSRIFGSRKTPILVGEKQSRFKFHGHLIDLTGFLDAACTPGCRLGSKIGLSLSKS